MRLPVVACRPRGDSTTTTTTYNVFYNIIIIIVIVRARVSRDKTRPRRRVPWTVRGDVVFSVDPVSPRGSPAVFLNASAHRWLFAVAAARGRTHKRWLSSSVFYFHFIYLFFLSIEIRNAILTCNVIIIIIIIRTARTEELLCNTRRIVELWYYVLPRCDYVFSNSFYFRSK